MMAASIDSNGQAFMQGLKNLLSEKSLQRLSEVKDYNGVQMTVEQHLTDVISAILSKGEENDTGLRIKLAMEAILKEGIEIPAPIYNFELCQLSLQNTIDEMNSQIDTVRKLFLKLGLSRDDTRSNSLCPTASFAKKAVKIFVGDIEEKDQSKALLKLYNEELDNLLKDPEEKLKRKVKHVGSQTNSLDFSAQTGSVKAAFCFMDDPKFKDLYEKWQGPRLENEKKTNKNQEITLAEQRTEEEAFDEFFAYYKEKVTAQMQQEFEILKSFLEEKNKGEENFLTGMSEVLQTYKWDAVKTLGTMTSIKFGLKSIFA